MIFNVSRKENFSKPLRSEFGPKYTMSSEMKNSHFKMEILNVKHKKIY